MTAQTQTLEFQAEARQLLHLVVHSIYSNKDTFLRELISNASDALDKLRMESFLRKDLDLDTSDLHIELILNSDARTLTLRDNGIGMSRDEVISLIGTIAKSGTAELLRSIKQSGGSSPELIGQFGVGFYSSFMVADQVTLVTRRAGEDQGTRWESSGESTYTLESVDDAPAGTAVTLLLKQPDEEDQLFDYTEESKLREIVKRYSDFISWPIRLGDETLNSMKALWARSKDEVTEAEYHDFYRHVSHDWTDPAATIHMKAEGTFEYEALLFIPSQAPFDLYQRDSSWGVQLYVKRVLIMEQCDALLPEYLRFVKGVVDARDLSLNVSREILQQDRHIQVMRRRLSKKVLATIKELMTDQPQSYASIWEHFGRALKEGIYRDAENRDAILAVASFASTHDVAELTTLAGYVERMKEDQDVIYYAAGASRSLIESSPHLEMFNAKGYEVLLLTEPVDEIWVDTVPQFDGKSLQSISKGEVDLVGEDETIEERDTYDGLLGFLRETLVDRVKDVRLSTRLTSSPACVVGDTHDMSPTLEKLYRSLGQGLPATARILELNPGHALVLGLRTALAAEPGDEAKADLAGTAEVLYGMALLAEGVELPDPAKFTRLVADRLARTL